MGATFYIIGWLLTEGTAHAIRRSGAQVHKRSGAQVHKRTVTHAHAHAHTCTCTHGLTGHSHSYNKFNRHYHHKAPTANQAPPPPPRAVLTTTKHHHQPFAAASLALVRRCPDAHGGCKEAVGSSRWLQEAVGKVGRASAVQRLDRHEHWWHGDSSAVLYCEGTGTVAYCAIIKPSVLPADSCLPPFPGGKVGSIPYLAFSSLTKRKKR